MDKLGDMLVVVFAMTLHILLPVILMCVFIALMCWLGALLGLSLLDMLIKGALVAIILLVLIYLIGKEQ